MIKIKAKTLNVLFSKYFLNSAYYFSLCFKILLFALTVLAVAKNPMVLIFQEFVPSLKFDALNLIFFGRCPKRNHIKKLLIKTCKVPLCNQNYLT